MKLCFSLILFAFSLELFAQDAPVDQELKELDGMMAEMSEQFYGVSPEVVEEENTRMPASTEVESEN